MNEAGRTVVIAPDSFKGTADAASIARAVADGWREIRPYDRLLVLPQADGGEGTLDALAVAEPAARWHVVEGVCGPDRRGVNARWLELPGRVGAIELAASSGLPLMARPDPRGATTRGLGQVIAAALDAGMTSLLIGLGGSASTDAGAPVLTELGFELTGQTGPMVVDDALDLGRVESMSAREVRPLPPGGVEVLTDALVPLTGPHGAAHTFGAQKGADAELRTQLDAALAHFASAVEPNAGRWSEVPGAGAAGGTGFALLAWGATLVPGARRINQLTGLTAAIGDADLVITGEGRFDATSSTGKLVGSVLQQCAAERVRSLVIAGELAVEPPDLGTSLIDTAGSAERALADPLRWAREAAAAQARSVSWSSR